MGGEGRAGIREGVVGLVTNRNGRANRICRIKETEEPRPHFVLCLLWCQICQQRNEQFATLELTAAAREQLAALCSGAVDPTPPDSCLVSDIRHGVSNMKRLGDRKTIGNTMNQWTPKLLAGRRQVKWSSGGGCRGQLDTDTGSRRNLVGSWSAGQH